MKTEGVALSCLSFFLGPSALHKQEFDNSLRKIDRDSTQVIFESNSGLAKLRKSHCKMGVKNPYMPGLLLREAKIDLASGLLKDFDKTLNDALLSSNSIFGDNSTSYASTLVDVAVIYNDFGNYRISREYVDRARDLLVSTNQLTDLLKARLALVEAEAMTGQGFSNEAIALLRSVESHFAGRAVEKNACDGTSIKRSAYQSRNGPRFTDRLNCYIGRQSVPKKETLSRLTRFQSTNRGPENQRYMG